MTNDEPTAGSSPVERPVGRPEPERTCEQGCNGCEDCTDYEDDGAERDTTCKHCHGTGGDPWNDGILPCEHCDGEGYEWWN